MAAAFQYHRRGCPVCAPPWPDVHGGATASWSPVTARSARRCARSPPLALRQRFAALRIAFGGLAHHAFPDQRQHGGLLGLRLLAGGAVDDGVGDLLKAGKPLRASAARAAMAGGRFGRRRSGPNSASDFTIDALRKVKCWATIVPSECADLERSARRRSSPPTGPAGGAFDVGRAGSRLIDLGGTFRASSVSTWASRRRGSGARRAEPRRTC